MITNTEKLENAKFKLIINFKSGEKSITYLPDINTADIMFEFLAKNKDLISKIKDFKYDNLQKDECNIWKKWTSKGVTGFNSMLKKQPKYNKYGLDVEREKFLNANSINYAKIR